MSDIKAVLIKDGKPSGEILDVFVEIDVLNAIGYNVYNVINLIDKKSRKIIALISLSGPTEPTQENWVDLVKGELDFRESSDGERFLETLLYSDYFPENFSISGEDWIGHTVLNIMSTTPKSGFFILIPNEDICSSIVYESEYSDFRLSVRPDRFSIFANYHGSDNKSITKEFVFNQPLSVEQIANCYATLDFSAIVKRDSVVEFSPTDEISWIKLGSLEFIILEGSVGGFLSFDKDPMVKVLTEIVNINPDIKLKDLLPEDESKMNTNDFIINLVKRFGD